MATLSDIHAVFDIPTTYTIPPQELARYQLYITEELYPVFARVMDCDTMVDCECYACKHATLFEDETLGRN